MSQEELVTRGCVELLRQAYALIGCLDPEIYKRAMAISPRGSIGTHVRHILDFFENFLRGIETGFINNNQRERNLRIENDLASAAAQIANLIERMESFRLSTPQRLIQVRTEDHGEGNSAWCTSSILRELDFLQSHTIHHFSLIAMLARLQGIEPGSEFGVAPSTLSYWKEVTTCAQ